MVLISSCKRASPPVTFDGNRAFADIQHQVDVGPRIPETEPHAKIQAWMVNKLTKAGWETEQQRFTIQGHEIVNIIAKHEVDEESPWIILGTHYDTRMFADQDENFLDRNKPVPGANDGASGVSILLELARILPDELSVNLWMVFFDAEDNGNIPGFDWDLGSTAYVQSLEEHPDKVVVIDMVGDKDLNIHIEKNSDQEISQEIWRTAADIGYSEQFVPTQKYRMIDDHLPFIQKGIPAALIIDFDYPYWHKTTDTVDKVSATSLQVVGDVLLAWLTELNLNQ